MKTVDLLFAMTLVTVWIIWRFQDRVLFVSIGIVTLVLIFATLVMTEGERRD